MSNFFKLFTFLAMLTQLLSCTPGPPYEIKSPCVAIEPSDDAAAGSPCVRRPINSKFDMA